MQASEIKNIMSASINFGDYDNDFLNSHDLIRIIRKRDYKKFKNEILISSLQRYQKLDSKRGDIDESSMTYAIPNPEKKEWIVEGEDMRCFGAGPTKKTKALAGRNSISLPDKNIREANNLHLYRFHMYPKTNTVIRLKILPKTWALI